MLNFPDAPIIGERYPEAGAPAFQWDGVKWRGLPDDSSMTASLDAPLVDGAATPGALALYQRGDHVHPSDGSRAPVVAPYFSGGMSADYIVVNGNVASGVHFYANGGSIIAESSADGGQPSFCCYAWDRGYAHGMFLNTNNYLTFGNMWGDGTPASAPAAIDISGNLFLSTTVLVGRETAAPLEMATKQYTDSRVISGAYMPITGGQMSGLFYPNVSSGSLMGGPPLSMEVRGNSGDSYITFHRAGHFACNFGCSSDWNFWFGGWSYGAGVAYRLWSTRDFGGLPVTDGRMAYCGDFLHTANTGMQEPYGGAGITGTSGYQVGAMFYMRYRAKQLLTNGWYTIGYA